MEEPSTETTGDGIQLISMKPLTGAPAFCVICTNDAPEMRHVRGDKVQVDVDPPPSASREDMELYEAQTHYLRYLLRMYFYPAFRINKGIFTFNLMHCSVFLVQIIKVSLITTQMFNFGGDRGNFSDVVYRGHLALTHMLLKGWDASWETLAYPPAHGAFAQYTITDLEESIDYAVSGFYNAAPDAIGFYVIEDDDKMIAKAQYFDFPGFTDSNLTDKIVIKDLNMPIDIGLSCSETVKPRKCKYSIRREFQKNELTQPFKRLLQLDLEFIIHSVRIYAKEKRAMCLKINGTVSFTDVDNNGRVKVGLETLSTKIGCAAINITVSDWHLETTSEKFGIMVIVFSTISLVITVASIIFAGYICVTTKHYMKRHYRRFYAPLDKAETDLPVKEYSRYVRFWDYNLIISDILTLYATAWIVFKISASDWVLATLDSYTVYLGAGCILAWVNLLRYFKFTSKFQLLFRTLYYAFWDVVAYITCVFVLFIGYWVCGYVVMGPYHVKFKTPSTAMETMFALIMGDEIFTTLAILETDKTGGNWVFWFSRVFIISYVFIFAIVVMNLLIALYMSAYDTIKNKDNPEERDLGSVEKALRRYLVSDMKDNHLRSSLHELMGDNKHHSSEEILLRKELSKLVRVSSVDNQVVCRKPRTLRALMEDCEGRTHVMKLGHVKLKFELFSCWS